MIESARNPIENCIKKQYSTNQPNSTVKIYKNLPPLKNQMPLQFLEIVNNFKIENNKKMDWKEYAEKKHEKIPHLMKVSSSKIISQSHRKNQHSYDFFSKLETILPYLNLQV